MSKNQNFEEFSLVLGDRINLAFILGQAILDLLSALGQPEGQQSPQQVRECALAVFNLIPSSWVKTDEQFNEDLKKCFNTTKNDNRSEWCGRKVGAPECIHLKDKTECFECERLEECESKEENLGPWRLLPKCMDVMDRRNLLSKPQYQEIFTGDRIKNLKKAEREEEG
jgi:hypothetical protein